MRKGALGFLQQVGCPVDPQLPQEVSGCAAEMTAEGAGEIGGMHSRGAGDIRHSDGATVGRVQILHGSLDGRAMHRRRSRRRERPDLIEQRLDREPPRVVAIGRGSSDAAGKPRDGTMSTEDHAIRGRCTASSVREPPVVMDLDNQASSATTSVPIRVWDPRGFREHGSRLTQLRTVRKDFDELTGENDRDRRTFVAMTRERQAGGMH